MTNSLPLNTALVAGLACSILALAAVPELAPSAVRARRVVVAVVGGHGVVAAILLVGVAPNVPPVLPLTGLAAAAVFGVASLAVVRYASPVNRPPRPLLLAPRVAAIALVVQALLQRWVSSATSLAMPPRAPTFLAIAALGVIVLASLAIITLRVRARWALAGLVAWAVGWVAITADLGALILWAFGGAFPMRSHQLRQLDAELIQVLATAGGLVIAAALVASIRDVRFRHSAVVLLVGYAVFGVLAAVAEHRIDLATDFRSVSALRTNRDLAGTITAFALAAVLWLYWRRLPAARSPRRR